MGYKCQRAEQIDINGNFDRNIHFSFINHDVYTIEKGPQNLTFLHDYQFTHVRLHFIDFTFSFISLNFLFLPYISFYFTNHDVYCIHNCRKEPNISTLLYHYSIKIYHYFLPMFFLFSFAFILSLS